MCKSAATASTEQAICSDWAGKVFLPFACISKIYSRRKEGCSFHLTETALRIKHVCVRQSSHVGDASSLGADVRSITGGFSAWNKHFVFTRNLDRGPKTEQEFHNQISHFWQSAWTATKYPKCRWHGGLEMWSLAVNPSTFHQGNNPFSCNMKHLISCLVEVNRNTFHRRVVFNNKSLFTLQNTSRRQDLSCIFTQM